MRNDPIFLTGVYRSGTSIVSRVLDAHPELDITFDSVNYFRFVIKKKIGPEHYENIVREITDRLKQRVRIILDTEKILAEIRRADEISHNVIYDAVMNGFFGFTGKRWGEKTLMEWTNIPLFLSMFPQGKAIHIIRDPRDVLASYKKMTIETGDKYLDSAFANMHSMDSALNYMKTLPADRYFILKYEDFVTDKESRVKRMCEFLEIEYKDVMLDETKYTDLAGEQFEPATHSSFPGRDELPKDRWKKHLDRFEIEFVESLLWRQMQAFGYPLSSSSENRMIKKFVETIDNEPLLGERFINYLRTGQGVESYPSDPTEEKNWGGDLFERGKGAAMAYGKKTN